MRLAAVITLLAVLVVTAFGAAHAHGLKDPGHARDCSACQLQSNPAEPTTAALAAPSGAPCGGAVPPPQAPFVQVPARWRNVPEQGPPARA